MVVDAQRVAVTESARWMVAILLYLRNLRIEIIGDLSALCDEISRAFLLSLCNNS